MLCGFGACKELQACHACETLKGLPCASAICPAYPDANAPFCRKVDERLDHNHSRQTSTTTQGGARVPLDNRAHRPGPFGPIFEGCGRRESRKWAAVALRLFSMSLHTRKGPQPNRFYANTAAISAMKTAAVVSVWCMRKLTLYAGIPHHTSPTTTWNKSHKATLHFCPHDTLALRARLLQHDTQRQRRTTQHSTTHVASTLTPLQTDKSPYDGRGPLHGSELSRCDGAACHLLAQWPYLSHSGRFAFMLNWSVLHSGATLQCSLSRTQKFRSRASKTLFNMRRCSIDALSSGVVGGSLALFARSTRAWPAFGIYLRRYDNYGIDCPLAPRSLALAMSDASASFCSTRVALCNSPIACA